MPSSTKGMGPSGITTAVLLASAQIHLAQAEAVLSRIYGLRESCQLTPDQIKAGYK